MNFFKQICLTLFLLIISNVSYSQLYDGTIAPDTFIKIIKANIAEESAMGSDFSSVSLSVNLYISVHVFRDTLGNVVVNKTDLAPVLSTANNFFKIIGIQFSIDTFDIVDDYNYANISRNQNTKELLAKHSNLNKINLYIVDSIKMSQTPCFGYTYFPVSQDSNYIFLCKQYLTGNNLTMLLGHFFGLLSTHESKGGIEFVNEKKCKTSGDFICDTYADPGLKNVVDNNCVYNGTAMDPNGDYYIPSVANIMSDSPGQCKCIITPLQYRRMLYYYKKYRQYLK